MAKRTVITPDATTDAPHADQVTQVISSLRSETTEQLTTVVGEASAQANNALAATAGRLNQQINRVAGAAPTRQEMLQQLSDALGQMSGALSSQLHGGDNAVRQQVQSQMAIGLSALRQELSAALTAAMGQAMAQANNDLGRAVADLRFGGDTSVQTVDATPAVAATLTPLPNAAWRVEAKIVGQRTDSLEAAIYSLVALIRAVPSSQVLTVSGLPNDGSQVEIDGKTYTLQTVLTDVDGNVQLGVDAQTTIDNLVAAINLTGTPGTDYAASMTIHPTFSASKASASTMEAVAKLPGTGANGSSTTDPVDVGVVLAWGGATTAGGLDLAVFGETITAEYEDDAAWNVTAAASGSSYEISVTGVADTSIEWKVSAKATEVLSA